MNGSGYVSSKKYYFLQTGTQSTTFSDGTVEITDAGNGILSAVITIGQKFDGTGEGPYTYDETSGTATFVDSTGITDTLVFTEENGQILLSVTMFYAHTDATVTITLSGTRK